MKRPFQAPAMEALIVAKGFSLETFSFVYTKSFSIQPGKESFAGKQNCGLHQKHHRCLNNYSTYGVNIAFDSNLEVQG